MKDFIDETREDLFQSIKTANKLVELGYMLFAGTNGNNPLAGNKYITMISNSKYDRYGAYDNEIFGFNQIRIKHSENVLPIVVKKTKDFDIGTGFTFQMGKLKCIATAKHCITDMSKVIISLSGINIIPTAIVTSTNHNIDIAVIFLDEETQALIQNPFEFEKSDILDNVLTMGYPELPGFDALLVSEISQVNSIQKNSIGNIVGEDKSFLDSQDYIVINAKVKSGNSGSPIINKRGFVSGILVNIPQNSQDQSKLDDLGYGLGLFYNQIEKIIKDVANNNETEYESISFEKQEGGFKTI